MRSPADAGALTTGLLFLVVAGLGLWSAFGPPDVGLLGIVLPIALIVVGIIGINSTRK